MLGGLVPRLDVQTDRSAATVQLDPQRGRITKCQDMLKSLPEIINDAPLFRRYTKLLMRDRARDFFVGLDGHPEVQLTFLLSNVEDS